MGIRSTFGKAIGFFGSALRKVGDFGGSVARKVGEFAAPVGGLASSIADMVGRPDIAAAITKGTDWLTGFAPKAEAIMSKVEGVGSGMRNVSNRLLT
jgi:hypothetical protein